MGFPGKGAEFLAKRLAGPRPKTSIIGINIGKNFDTPNENAADDYLHCLDKVYPYADYVTVNISSPNTKNLRELQGEDELDALLGALAARAHPVTVLSALVAAPLTSLNPTIGAGMVTGLVESWLRKPRVSDLENLRYDEDGCAERWARPLQMLDQQTQRMRDLDVVVEHVAAEVGRVI